MSLFSNFLKKEESHALGIDIGSSAIKVVQIKKKNGQAVLETYGELALGPYGGTGVGRSVVLPPDKISTALRDLMNEKEVNVTTNICGLSIPFSSALMSVMDLPQVSEKQLQTMVPLEARKYIPVPISEVMLDWSVIPKSEEVPEEEEEKDSNPNAPVRNIVPRVEVLAVAIHKDTIAKYQDIVTKAGLDAGFFEIEIFSTMRSVVDETIKPIMVIDMGASTTKLFIVERGIIRGSHTINRGAQDITASLTQTFNMPSDQAEITKREVGLLGADKNMTDTIALVLDFVFSEVNSTMLAYEKKYNKAISKVFMVGGGAALKGLLTLAKDNLKTEVELGLPFGKVATPTFLEKVLKETGPEFAVAVGLALRKLSEEK